MRSAAAYYLILLYAAAVCKPFLPIVADFLAHTFQHGTHIETVHHKHGANHVHHELKETAKAAGENTKAASLSEPVALHLPTPSDYNFLSTLLPLSKAHTYSNSIRQSVSEIPFPPPKA